MTNTEEGKTCSSHVCWYKSQVMVGDNQNYSKRQSIDMKKKRFAKILQSSDGVTSQGIGFYIDRREGAQVLRPQNKLSLTFCAVISSLLTQSRDGDHFFPSHQHLMFAECCSKGKCTNYGTSRHSKHKLSSNSCHHSRPPSAVEGP